MYTHLVCVLPDGDIHAFQDDLLNDEVIKVVHNSTRVIATESNGTVSCIKGGSTDETVRYIQALVSGGVAPGTAFCYDDMREEDPHDLIIDVDDEEFNRITYAADVSSDRP